MDKIRSGVLGDRIREVSGLADIEAADTAAVREKNNHRGCVVLGGDGWS
jgi:hypothetical protein